MPDARDSASSGKKSKQRHLVTQRGAGRVLAAGRCAGVIAATINISGACEELGAVARRAQGQAGAVSGRIYVSWGKQEGYQRR